MSISFGRSTTDKWARTPPFDQIVTRLLPYLDFGAAVWWRCVSRRVRDVIDEYYAREHTELTLPARGDQGVTELVANKIAPNVTHLSAYGADGAFAALKLFEPPKWKHLGNGIYMVDGKVTMDITCRFRWSKTLEVVDFSGNRLGARGGSLMKACLAQLRAVHTLNLAMSHLGSEGVALFASELPEMASLTSLNLSGNAIGGVTMADSIVPSEGSTAMLEALSSLSLLVDLDVSSNQLGDAVCADLASRVQALPKLSTLRIKANAITPSPTGWEAIARRLAKCTALRNLYVGYNRDWGVVGASTVSAYIKRATTLKHLDVQYNDVGDDGAYTIAQALPKSGLTYLNLRGNHVKDRGATKLAQALPDTPQLVEVDVAHNQITPEGAADFADSLPSCNLASLDISFNKLGFAGVLYIAQKLPKVDNLRRLYVGGNGLGPDGGQGLAGVLAAGKRPLTHLSLCSNGLERETAERLAYVLRLSPGLTWVDVSGNYIGEEAVRELEAIPTVATVVHELAQSTFEANRRNRGRPVDLWAMRERKFAEEEVKRKADEDVALEMRLVEDKPKGKKAPASTPSKPKLSKSSRNKSTPEKEPELPTDAIRVGTDPEGEPVTVIRRTLSKVRVGTGIPAISL